MRTLLILMACLILQTISSQPKIVLVQNGESEWSKLNLFVGWSDDPLSEQGRKDVIQSGKLLKEGGFQFDVCYTSSLRRAIHTAFYILDELDQLHIPISKALHLNDRHYGALQGLNKKALAEKYGSEQINIWQRSYDIPPPALEEDDERHPANQKKYKIHSKSILPFHESLRDTIKRVGSYFNEVIFPDLKSGKNILIIAHGDSLKGIIKYLDNLSEQEIVDLNIPKAVPFVYEFDENFNPIKRYYLGNQVDIFDRINSSKNTDLNLDIIIVDKLSEKQEKEVWEIVKKSDNDFIPPLSARTDTVHKFSDHKEVQNAKKEEVLAKFFYELKKESFVLILNDGKIEGFMSFIKEYPLKIDQGTIICDYITIIIIDPNCRNKGYTQKMYYEILTARKEKKIATRTWSTNNSHMNILDKLGFKLIQRDINDRGENIDSVYYLKTPKN